MDRIARLIRLVTGLGMVAAGTALAAPATIEIHGWWQAMSRPDRLLPTPGGGAGLQPAPASSLADAWSGDPPAGPGPDPRGWPEGDPEASLPVAVDRDYVPPPPPAPLPPAAALPLQSGAALATAYRSTLAVPPPPLLDGEQPPPLAPGWSGRKPEPVGARQPVTHAMGYVIRDGDDLTGIANRFYGHPAAAAAIWEANRSLLPDPGILPIGVMIQLPHPDAIDRLVQVGRRSPTIEPAGSPGPVRAVGQTRP